ncbi:hypothetical protein [Roseococcus pinisoli]|uniref:Anti-sigma factor NepR domain-containing protein n=1 Tax=Roseococcus pinisoli TaxID=2835040 RepID=A0ABS5QEM1_9PROT|nr:hypothetical protein [Roseococcus pinisoli]MBS7812144.1 hypothetical protein [Roseococcus pinisoli]
MPRASTGSQRSRRNSTSEVAFDSWLNRSLRASFGEVTQEPVPAALLDLVRAHSPGS